MYETFEHTADVGLRVRAVALNDLFAEAAQGLASLQIADIDTLRPAEERLLQIMNMLISG